MSNSILGSHKGFKSFRRCFNPKICNLRIRTHEISSCSEFKILKLSLAEYNTAINSSLDTIRVFKGGTLFLEATKAVLISFSGVDTRK